MIRSIYFSNGNPPKRDLTLTDMEAAIKSETGLLWVSLENPDAAEATKVLRDTFHFHPLVVEDTLSAGYQAPKIDDFGSYIFLITHALQPGEGFVDTEELDAFLGKSYLVTSYLGKPITSVETIWKRMDRDERLTQHGADFLLHAILDALVDEYLPFLDRMDDRIELLQDQVIEKPKPPILEQLLELKHQTMSLRRIISPQREVMNRLSRDDFPQIDQQSRIYYRDIYDHLVRIQDFSESVRDLISDSLDIYLSATSNKLNEVMKALTIVSTIFLPMSFVAGVYGMNFHFMPELSWRYGYAMAWVIFLIIPAVMLTYFKKKGWY